MIESGILNTGFLFYGLHGLLMNRQHPGILKPRAIRRKPIQIIQCRATDMFHHAS